MIKTILAEDDIEMLEGLTHVICWEDYGFTIAGAAKNGFEALNLVTELSPEVIITDISMPVMGGMELIREAKNFQPGIRSIIISCHEEFEYAREAIRLQADEYLIKHTLTEEILVQTINKLKQSIQTQNKQIQKYYGFEAEDTTVSSEQSYRLAELAKLYDEFAPKLKNAARERDPDKLMAMGRKFLACSMDQYHTASLKAVLSRLLIDVALAVPDTGGISIETLQMKDNGNLSDAFERTLRLMASKLAASPGGTSNADISKAIGYIDNHLGEDISCEKLAAYVNMSSSYFSRLFKRETGVSFSDFVIRKRISKSTELLYNTSCTIEEIIHAVGIESISYFYRTYKRVVGCTPGDVRVKARRKDEC